MRQGNYRRGHNIRALNKTGEPNATHRQGHHTVVSHSGTREQGNHTGALHRGTTKGYRVKEVPNGVKS